MRRYGRTAAAASRSARTRATWCQGREAPRPPSCSSARRNALAHFAPGRKITEVHGTPIVERERVLVPWLHPSAALRNPALRETLFHDARALGGQILQSRNPPGRG